MKTSTVYVATKKDIAEPFYVLTDIEVEFRMVLAMKSGKSDLITLRNT